MTYNKYTTTKRKFKHLTYKERKLIERWLNEKMPKTQIAKLLGIHRSSLYNEIKRGSVVQKRTDLTTYTKYFADVGQRVYEENRKRCRKSYKLSEAVEFIEDVEKEILENKLSPETACGKLKRNKKYSSVVSYKTIYNYIDLGLLKVKNIDLLLKVKIKTKKYRVRKNKRILGDSIENRPTKINERTEFGHWEIDTIVGTVNSKSVLLTLDERMTRKRFIIKITSKTASAVNAGLSEIMSRFKGYENVVFKSITSDNGSEFSALTETFTGTHIYYAHPYSSFERGTNEKQNSLVRRFFKKGTDFDKIGDEAIKRTEKWINCLPRKAFGYIISEEMFAKEIKKICH